MSNNTLTITDNRTGQTYEVPINDETIKAIDLRQVRVQADDFGLMTYDPGFTNTASCKSRITYIDGDKGILEYRGYPIEQLAEQSSFLEVAYLLIFGVLPTVDQLAHWEQRIMRHTYIHENLTDLLKTFRYDAHPMGILVSAIAAMSTLHPEAKQVHDSEVRLKQIYRILGKLPTVAAFAYRHRIGRPYNYPDSTLGYAGNFLYMLDFMGQSNYQVNPVLAHALDVLFILHADHEQNCSTSAMRGIASSEADPYSSMAGAAAALYGPLHGGANEAVLRMLREIGSVANIPGFIERVKKREVRLMGFGHRVYKNYDPRARIIKKIAYEVFEVTQKNPLLDIAIELERIALEDDYFISRKLYPNVDFYSGIIYQAMGFPVEMFPVLFAIPRTAGWLAQWEELLLDPEQKIARPRQIY
ncbi:MAG: citrate synthase, partial [Chloroflexi bacterium]